MVPSIMTNHPGPAEPKQPQNSEQNTTLMASRNNGWPFNHLNTSRGNKIRPEVSTEIGNPGYGYCIDTVAKRCLSFHARTDPRGQGKSVWGAKEDPFLQLRLRGLKCFIHKATLHK